MTDKVIEKDWEIDRSIQDLYDILSLRRSAGSDGEQVLIKKFLIPAGLNRDDYGNWYIRVGTDPILWSCHIDTVHREEDDDVIQKLQISRDGILSAKDSSCLGADCGAGIWLMLRMLKAGKDGLYIFHRDEEIGGKGSNWISQHNKELLEGIQIAIAFDRRGTQSIITYQAGSRCCSDNFAVSLSEQLGMDHMIDEKGLFTDTANYTDLIPECTNLSVGYYHEHTYNEYLDTDYLKVLLPRLLELDVKKLVVERDHTKAEKFDFWELYQTISPTERETLYIKQHAATVYKVLREWGVYDEVKSDVENFYWSGVDSH